MKCAICKKEVGFASVKITDTVETHLDCFYDEDIPNASKSTKEERQAAIEKKVKKLIDENDKQSSGGV